MWQGARSVALYKAADGELDPDLLLRMAWRAHKTCYLPVLHPIHPQRMVFVRVTRATRLYRNRWGIAEPRPVARDIAHVRRLDIVMVPLVGFDRDGRRMGMGKGYYDRTFESRLRGRRCPRLLGLAHDCQRVTQGIQTQPWDVPMDMIITPAARYAWRRNRP